MLKALKRKWQELKRGTPGKRFQHAYENARRHRKDTPFWFRILRLGLALAAMVIGVVFAVIPGPAVVFFALGGVLLATESRAVALVLDWIELRLRAIVRWAKRRWDRLNRAGRIVVMMVGACGSAGMATLTFWFFFIR